MASNGKQTPPRPQLSIEAPEASAREAAAIAAALQQFMAETAPVPVSAPPESRWQRLAMLEAVGAESPDSAF